MIPETPDPEPRLFLALSESEAWDLIGGIVTEELKTRLRFLADEVRFDAFLRANAAKPVKTPRERKSA